MPVPNIPRDASFKIDSNIGCTFLIRQSACTCQTMGANIFGIFVLEVSIYKKNIWFPNLALIL